MLSSVGSPGAVASDDGADTVRRRLKVYEDATLPILDLYEQRYDVHHINGDQSVETVTEEILRLVGE